MLYLLLAILCSTTSMVIFKFSESGENNNRYAVTFINQLTAFAVSCFFLFGSSVFRLSWFRALFAEWGSVFSGQAQQFSEAASPAYAILVAVLGGIITYIAYYVLQLSTAKNGSAMTVTFNKVGVLIPAVLSVIFFHESPSVMQAVGVVVAMLAIVLIYFKKEEISVITLKIALIGTLFFGGFCDFVSKIYENYGLEAYQSLFLSYLFFFSTVLALTNLLRKNRTITKKEIRFGVISGFIAQFISRFLLQSLNFLPAFVVFPLYSVGVILLINGINLLFFKEKLTKRQFAAVGLMIAACVLLNI